MAEAQAVTAAEDHKGVMHGLGDLEWLGCVFPDGVTVEAEARPDLPWRFMFEGWHPKAGLRYFRARRRGAARSEIGPSQIEVWDVTEAYARLARLRTKRAKGRARLAPVARTRNQDPKPGSPTPERRRRGERDREPIARETVDETLVHRAPDRLLAMHRRRTLTAAQLHEAGWLHQVYLKAGFDQARAADIMRTPGAGQGLPDGMLDARDTLRGVIVHLGGADKLACRVLLRVVGEGLTIEKCLRAEGAGGGHRRDMVMGVLTGALDAVAGFRAVRGRMDYLRRMAAEGAVKGVLGQGA